MNWYFIRHGEVESNLKKIYAGWSEEVLTRKGRQEAAEAAKIVYNFNIDSIYTSPLRRAVQTAEIIGGFLKKQPILEESFKELKLEIWEGKNEKEIQRDFPDEWKIWDTRPAEFVLEGRESLQELLERVLGGLRKIREQKVDSSMLTVTNVAVFEIMQYIRIESEYLLITAISTNDLTVERGVNGSTPAEHASGTQIDQYQQTPEIAQEARRLAIRHFELRAGIKDSFVATAETVIEIDPNDVRLVVAERITFGVA